MTYSPEEKKQIDILIAAFSEYIHNSKISDILFSEKFGFLVVCPEKTNGDGTFFVVQDYDHLLNWLCSEVAFDFFVLDMDYEEVIAKSCAYLEPILNCIGEDKERCYNEMEKSLKKV